MKREELKALGLEDANIDAIMKINGEDINSAKKDVDALTIERDGFKKTLGETNEKLKDFEKMDIEGIKASVISIQGKYDTDTKDLQTKLDKQGYDHKIEKYASGTEFSSAAAKESVLAKLKAQEFKQDGEKLLGADDFMKNLKEADPAAFKVVDKNTPPPNTPPPKWGEKPIVNNPPPQQTETLVGALREKFK